MSKTYSIEIAGLKRELPICPVNDKLDIAAFVIFGDVEMTVKSAEELLKKCPEFDYILTPEARAYLLLMRCPGRAEKNILLPARKPRSI